MPKTTCANALYERWKCLASYRKKALERIVGGIGTNTKCKDYS